jgi:two-component system OmpR family response regulator
VGALTVFPEQRRVEWSGRAGRTDQHRVQSARNAGPQCRTPGRQGGLVGTGAGRPLVRFDRSIDVHLSSIRRKLGTLPDGRSCIQTVYRQGYQLIKE